MQKTKKILLNFPGLTADRANRYAQSLQQELRVGDVEAEQSRTDSESQDFGATLVLILGTASVTAVAHGIQAWLARNNVQLEISTGTGKVIAKNIHSHDAAAIAASISKAIGGSHQKSAIKKQARRKNSKQG